MKMGPMPAEMPLLAAVRVTLFRSVMLQQES